jgi:hypothetical protein
VYEKVGALDERLGIGFFDDDLAERARRAGFQLALAHDLFVHHFGSRTFAANAIDAEALLDENQQRFAAKWGLPQVGGRRVALRPLVVSPRRAGGVGGAKGRQATRRAGEPVPVFRVSEGPRTKGQGRLAPVNLTMNARNEGNNLPRVLESVQGLFDEIIVADTGSTDLTVEIARSFGARVSDFPGRRFWRGQECVAGPRDGRLRVLARCRSRCRSRRAGEDRGAAGATGAAAGGDAGAAKGDAYYERRASEFKV